MLDWNRFVRERLALELRPERESDIINELAQLMEHAYTDAVAGGATHEEALRRAEKEAGDWQKLSREITAAEAQPKLPEAPPERMSMFAGFKHDLVYALRFLRKKPVFALIAAGTLAFGIGANTSMFTLVDAIALRGLPYPEPSRLVTLGAHRENQKDIAIFTSAPDFFDLRKQATSFTDLAGISPIWNLVTTGGSEADRLEALFVSSNLFPMLGVSPVAGRVFTTAEDQVGHTANVVVLGHSYWQRAYGGKLDALNKTITLDDSVYTIIGVMSPTFRYLGEPVVGTMTEPDVWIPMAANPLVGSGRGLRYMKVLGHLAPGVTSDQARDEVRRIGLGLAAQYPQTNKEKAWELRPLNDEAFGKYRTPVFLLLGAVGFVLLLASANVANLLLARVVERKQEMSIRTALGASAYRILRQLLAESLVLSAFGGLLGAGLALVILQILVKTGPANLMRAQKIGLDARALLFTTVIVILAATLSGLAPAWRTVTAEIGSALRASGRSLTAGTHRFRSGLVIVQVAVALVLLVGAGLLIRSFQNLLMVDPGFRSENLVTISTELPSSARTPERIAVMNRGMMEQLMMVPGVEQVAEVSRLPMMATDLTTDVMAEGKPAQDTEVQFRRTTPNYFQTMGIPVRAGRVYDSHDTSPVVLLDEVAARMIWPGENAVGKRIKVGSDSKWTTVIGVVGQTRNFGLDIAPSPTLYVSDIGRPLDAPKLVIRTSRDPAPLMNALSATIRRAYPGMPAYNVFQMQTLVDRSTAQRRFIMMLLTAFAMAAMLLAGVGVYGSISHTVAHRTREIGLRIALGATPGAAMRMVLAEGLRVTGAGVAIGIVSAAGLTRAMQSSLFEVKPLDPLAFAAGAAVLAIFAILACAVPALRSTRVDPIVALRDE